MRYDGFENLLNKTIFEESKSGLLRKIAGYPQRYAGLFRPSTPKAKLMQNLLQSHEIRFGDAFENLVGKYLAECGYAILEKSFTGDDGEKLHVDQVFSAGNKLFFVEQKIRDDHDSSKKRGQTANFEKKTAAILKAHAEKECAGFFYFVDAGFVKNRNYYRGEISRLSQKYKIPLHACYGAELFDQLGHPHVWPEILRHLDAWLRQIPELPEINFDKTPEASFAEIKNLPPGVFKKLFTSTELDNVLRVLFPAGKTLRLLARHFEQAHGAKEKAAYAELAELCKRAETRLRKP